MCASLLLFVSEALPDAVVSARSITVGSDHRAHYLFIGSSRHGDLSVVTTQAGGECALSPHAEQAASQSSGGALHVYSNAVKESTVAATLIFKKKNLRSLSEMSCVWTDGDCD